MSGGSETYGFDLGKYKSIYDLPVNRAKAFNLQIAALVMERKYVRQLQDDTLKHTWFYQDFENLTKAEDVAATEILKQSNKDSNDPWIASIIKQRKYMISYAKEEACAKAMVEAEAEREKQARIQANYEEAMERTKIVEAEREKAEQKKRCRYAKARKLVLDDADKIKRKENYYAQIDAGIKAMEDAEKLNKKKKSKSKS